MSKKQKMSGKYRGYHQMEAFHAIVEQIKKAILACLLVHLEAVDSNWHSLTIEFDHSIWTTRLELAERNRIEVDYKPLRAVVNGPLKGDVDITDKLGEEFVARELIGLLVASSVVHTNTWVDAKIYNKDHRIEIIPERTLVNFENCETGIVRRLVGSDFVVERGLDYGPHSERYSLERLEAEMELDDMCCQAVDVEYAPLLPPIPFSEEPSGSHEASVGEVN